MLLPFTTLPPADERRFLYTYLGQRMIGKGKAVFQPLYVYDGVRSRPTFIVGGGERFLLNLALKDASCGRTVIFLDGSNKREMLDQLYYWCGHHLKRPVYALMPQQDELSHTWNPWLSDELQATAIPEFFFDTYRRFSGKKINKSDSELQSEALTTLYRALHDSNIAFHCDDLADFLESKEAFQSLEGAIRSEGIDHYDELKHLMEFEGDFAEKIALLVKFLRLFKSWTLSSYRPSINLGRLISANAVVYAGLPAGWEDGDNRRLFCATGNLMIHHLRALVAHRDMNEREDRRSVSLIINKAEAFLDNDLVDWLGKMRLSKLMVTCAVASVEDLKVMGEKFMEQLRNDTPNIAFFNANDVNSSSWFAEMWNQKRMQDGCEVGDENTWAEQLNRLNPQQYLFESYASSERPMLLAAPFLPNPTPRPDYQYRRYHYNADEKPMFRTRYSRVEEERTIVS